jgi:hypothetical protein
MLPCAALLLVTSIGCRSTKPPAPPPANGRGAISVEVVPNPIVAKRVSGDMFEFPFDVVVRETGGRAINVTSVDVTVVAFAGLTLGHETWDAKRIQSTGTSTFIPARGEARYRFTQRREVPDERYLASVTARLTVAATDDAGTATSATTAVTISR